MVGKLKQGVSEVANHAGQYEGVQEEGLRMLVFGKPGSGKVRPAYSINGAITCELIGRELYLPGESPTDFQSR